MSDPTHPTGLISDSLLQTIKQGDRVLFLGADLPLKYAGAPLSRPELAAALAAAYELPRGLAWPRTVDAYLDRFANDRNGLIRFVQAQCHEPPVQPGPLHAAIARAGFRVVVTAWYDDRLERALDAAHYRVNCVVRDVQLPYAAEGERDIIVIKLYGCLSDPESLVLTSAEHSQLRVRLSYKLKVVTALCALRPPLFVGFDLADETPMDLYMHASIDLVEHMRRAYAVWPTDPGPARAMWRDQNIDFIRADAVAFLEALAAQLPTDISGASRDIRVHRPPYKFLDYYEAADADIFCGRDTESQIVTRLALSHRLLTLFGPSGAGKTSLLLAGVLPRLAAEDYRHVYVRALDDPLPALRRAIAARAGLADSAGLRATAGDLRSFLKATLAPTDKLIIILDQFEELFIRVGRERRQTLFAQLAAALNAHEREVRVILSLREDYLAHLDEARAALPDIFTNSFRLTALDRGNARVAITEPASRAGVTVEPALVDALVGALERRARGGAKAPDAQGELVEADGRVPPAALQIVLDRLYREALMDRLGEACQPAELDAPPPAGLTLTQALYRRITHTRQREGEPPEILHGAEAILAGYVHEGVAERLPALYPEADADLGRAILKVLVTSQATKAALTQAELVAYLDEKGVIAAGNARDQVRVENTRLGLERVRLLRGFERDGVAYYELAHDYLAAEIAAWISDAEMAAKLARELLRRELDNWQGAGLLIRPEVLALIHERRDELTRLRPEELELLFRSALAAGYEVPYWFSRAQEAGVQVDSVAQQGLHSDNFRTRAAAVTALGQLGERFVDAIIGMLSDAYPQVRVAAIHALEALRPDGMWREHLQYECYVPAGSFMMGEGDAAHEVTLDAYYIGKYPVTNAAYKRYMDDIGRAFTVPQGKADHPVVDVNWYDARDYAAWAGMRLLTEAEWEKAASWDVGAIPCGRPEGKKRKYPWGDEFDPQKCNTSESSIGITTPVGQYSPDGDSPYGCADMAGNVWEWTSSLYKDYPYRADDGREDMRSSNSRVLRGGAFDTTGDYARCAYRVNGDPNWRRDFSGFRVVVVASPFSHSSGL